MRTDNRRPARYLILGIAAVLASAACESPTGAGMAPPAPARTGHGYGSGNFVESDSSDATASGTESTMAADSGSTAITRGGVTFGAGN